MEADASLWSFNVALGVLLVDILLSGDNAIVIALVCRSLSKEHRSKALWLGVLGAFGARLLLTGVATLAMNLPLIKLIGGLLLLKISIDLIVDNAGPDGLPLDAQDSTPGDMFAAARTIILADIVMSLDNVVALSAVSQNNFQMLIAGLLLSIPILMFGSLYIARLLDVFPYLLWVGGAILGGVSGALVIDDPVFGGAFSSASSLANLVVPLIAALFVVQISRVIAANAGSMGALEKPRPLFDILWKSAAQPPLADDPLPRPAQAARPAQGVAGLATLPVAQEAVLAEADPAVLLLGALESAPSASSRATPAAKPARPAGVPPKGGEHRLVMALGLFMMLSGGAIYYMLNAWEAPVPDSFYSYFCKEPALSISFRPSAKQIRFATPKGSVTTTVIEDRIVWDDYRAAGARLALAPPVKIVQADAGKLVVHGGMFDNTSCLAAEQR
jgi:YjbE family integral membrane protein